MTRVVLSRSASSALAALDFLLADAILDALSELERDPRIGHDLRGRLRGLRSYRVGAYRIIYEVRDPNTVMVVAIRHRSQAYQTDPPLIDRGHLSRLLPARHLRTAVSASRLPIAPATALAIANGLVVR